MWWRVALAFGWRAAAVAVGVMVAWLGLVYLLAEGLAELVRAVLG